MGTEYHTQILPSPLTVVRDPIIFILAKASCFLFIYKDEADLQNITHATAMSSTTTSKIILRNVYKYHRKYYTSINLPIELVGHYATPLMCLLFFVTGLSPLLLSTTGLWISNHTRVTTLRYLPSRAGSYLVLL